MIFRKAIRSSLDRMKPVPADRSHRLVLHSDSNRGLECLAVVVDRVVKNRDQFEGVFGRELRTAMPRPNIKR